MGTVSGVALPLLDAVVVHELVDEGEAAAEVPVGGLRVEVGDELRGEDRLRAHQLVRRLRAAEGVDLEVEKGEEMRENEEERGEERTSDMRPSSST